MRSRRSERWRTWAVEGRFDWGRAFMGRYAFGHQVPAQLSGYTIAAFATRREARAAANSLGMPARVVRVELILRELRPTGRGQVGAS